MLVAHEIMDGQELDSGDTERPQIVDRRRRREPRVCAPQVLRDIGLAEGESLDMQLIDHGPIPWRS